MATHPISAAEQPVPLPGALTAPADGDIAVWWTTTDTHEAIIEGLRADLDEETRAKVDAMVRDADRIRGTLAHGLLRRLVAACTGQAPRTVALARWCASCGAADHGKPSLAVADGLEAPLQFNLAHSGAVVAVAIAGPSTPVGIDVEGLQIGFDWAPSRRHVFTDAEWTATAGGSDPSAARFALWARKEAAAKATGHGLAIDLARIGVSRDPVAGDARSGHVHAPDRAYDLLITDVALTPECVAAVACVGVGPPPRVAVTRALLSVG